MPRLRSDAPRVLDAAGPARGEVHDEVEDPDRTGIGARGALPQVERSGPLRWLVPTSLVSNTRLEGPFGLSELDESLPPEGA